MFKIRVKIRVSGVLIARLQKQKIRIHIEHIFPPNWQCIINNIVCKVLPACKLSGFTDSWARNGLQLLENIQGESKKRIPFVYVFSSYFYKISWKKNWFSIMLCPWEEKLVVKVFWACIISRDIYILLNVFILKLHSKCWQNINFFVG